MLPPGLRDWLVTLSPKNPSSHPELDRRREQMLTAIWIAALVLGAVALVVTILRALAESRYPMAMFVVLVYCWPAVCLKWRGKISFRVRAAGTVALTYLIGLLGFIAFGPFSVGLLWLFAFAALASVLFGVRAAYYATGILFVTMIGLGWGLTQRLFPWCDQYHFTIFQWIPISINVLLLVGFVAIAVAIIFDGLTKALVNEIVSREELEETNERLLAEQRERESAEETLRRSEENYRLLIDNAQEIILVMQDDLIKFANPYALRVLDLPDPGSEPQPFLAMLHPDDRRWVADYHDKLLNGEPVEGGYSARVVDRAGRTRWLDAVVAVISWDDRTASLIFASDVTESKTAAEEREKLEVQLRHAQKMEAVGTLASGVAHEFNNILSIILGFAELAQRGQKMKRDYTDELDQVIQATKRGSALVGQMLTFGRKMSTNRQPLDLNEAVDNALRILERTLPKNVTIETRQKSGLPLVLADSSQMEQILINLATNARDAMPEGGILTITTEPVALPGLICDSCGAEFAGDYVRLTVTDTGLGMDPATIGKMYEPFFSTKGVGRGTGLGLSVVLGLVHDHGGHLNCQSMPGRGTTFSIYLPASREKAAAARRVRPSEGQTGGGGETILIVDDEPAIRILADVHLSGAGYHTLTASSGEEALETYRERGAEIDLVLLDLGMPGMGGRQCLKELLKLDPKARIMVVSGYTTEANIRDSLAAGALDFMGKPFQSRELLAKIRQVLPPPPASDDRKPI